MSGLNIAVIEATGQIGRAMRTLLAKRDFPVETIRFFSSSRSSGTTLEWKGQHITVESVVTSDFSGIDIAVFSAGASISREHVPKFTAQGAVVVGSSSAWCRGPEVPPVISEVDPEDAAKRPRDIIVNPNCTTVAAMPVSCPLVDKADGLKRPFVSNCQAVSGSGIKGVQELVSQIRSGVNQDLAALALSGCAITLPRPEVYVVPIAFDAVPLAGSIVESGSEETDEEQKLRSESYRILHVPDLRVSGTCVCVPVFAGHTLTTHAEFPGTITTDEAREVLAPTLDVRLVEVPTLLEAAGHDGIFCGHIRQNQAVEGNRGLVLVLSDDNLRKGAALNAIQVAGVVAKELLG